MYWGGLLRGYVWILSVAVPVILQCVCGLYILACVWSCDVIQFCLNVTLNVVCSLRFWRLQMTVTNNNVHSHHCYHHHHHHHHTCFQSTVWVKKSSPPKTFCNIFTQVKYISVEFCQYVTSLYIHVLTNFGWFVLIFNKIVLIFLGVPIDFNVSSFKFHQVNSRWLRRQ